IEEIWDIINSYKSGFDSEIDYMNNLFNSKVVPYEEMDNNYASRAHETYTRYVTTWERIVDGIIDFSQMVGNFVDGVIKSVEDLIKGLVGLVKGVFVYAVGAVAVVISKVTGDTPDWLKGAEEDFYKDNEMIKAVLDDPSTIVEGIAQQVSDAKDEKGLAYCTGYTAGLIAQMVLLKKVKGGTGAESVSNPEISRLDYLRNKYGTLTSDQINNRINLRGAVNDEVERLYKSGISKRELGPAVAGVLDTSTGKYYFGINNIKGKVPGELHPLIKERLDNMPKNILDSYSNKTLGSGSHAEVYALNEALLANPNAKLNDFMIYVVRSGKKLKPKGLPMPRCPHCEFITDGANYFPEVLKYEN
ncbi:YwqJ-related putative deaminase, partial [Clostridium sp. HBUAS56017]|uniref:YwqJ-related putative deaminase n=1 Tax=Clostridium sp. HBUAS56017 TaxID=2571128 RepID=UPI001A9AA7DF